MAGKVIVNTGTTVSCQSTGRFSCTQTVQDFDLPQSDSVVLRLDGADIEQTTQRGPDGVVPRTSGLRWVPRILRNAAPATVFQPPANTTVAIFGVGKKNGRRTIAFRSESPGIEGTWGPFASAAFTIVAVLRTLEPINVPAPLLQSGSFTINLPMDNNTPQAALDNNTWRDAFLFQWRRLVIQNSVAANAQFWYVDDNLVATMLLFGQQLPSGPVTIGGGAPLEIAEVIVWDEVLPATTLNTMASSIRTKWNTDVSYPPPAPEPVALPVVDGGLELPTPNVLWLDSSHLTSLRTPAGQQASYKQQSVATWQDRSGAGRHATFASPYATLDFSPVTSVNGRPLLRVKSAAGVLPASVLAALGTGAFVIAALWEPNLSGGGGHPFNVDGRGRFSADMWTEGVASDFNRTFPSPEVPDLLPMVCVWERSSNNTVTVRLNNVQTDPIVGGYVWTNANQMDVDWTSQSLTIGGSNRPLAVGELMVWSGAPAESVQTEAGRNALRVHFFQKWAKLQAGTVIPSVQVVAELPMSIPVLPPPADNWDASASNALRTTGNVATTTAGTSVISVVNNATPNFLGSLTNGSNLTVSVSGAGQLGIRCIQNLGILSGFQSSVAGSHLDKLYTLVLKRSIPAYTHSGAIILSTTTGTATANLWDFICGNGLMWLRFYSGNAWRPNNGTHNIWYNVNGTTGVPLPPKDVPFVLQFQFHMVGNDLYIWTSVPSLGILKDEFVVTLASSTLPIAPSTLLRGGAWVGDIHEIRMDSVNFGSASVGTIADHLINKWAVPRFTSYTSITEGLVLLDYNPSVSLMLSNSVQYATFATPESVSGWVDITGTVVLESRYRSIASPVAARLHKTLTTSFGGVLALKSTRDHVFRSTTAPFVNPYKNATLFLVFRMNMLGNDNDVFLFSNRVGSESHNDGWALIVSTNRRLRYVHYTQALSPVQTTMNITANAFEFCKTYVLGFTWPATGNVLGYFTGEPGATPSVTTVVHPTMNQTKTQMQFGGRINTGSEIHSEVDFYAIHYWNTELPDATMINISQVLASHYCK